MSLTIPQTDPRANYYAHRTEIDAAIHGVLEGGRYILGQNALAFENEFAAYLGLEYATGVGSGTDALHVALRACGAGPDIPVFTVSHTAVATVAAIELCGARPVLVDIDPATYTLDPNCLEEALKAWQTDHSAATDRSGGRWGAVIPVHLYGRPADMPAIIDLADRYGLWVIEDCAQSQGAEIAGRKVGTFGHLAATSFYPTKNLGALGDGGLVATGDATLGERFRLLREYGWRERYVSEIPGLNSRLDELQAAVLRVKLRYLDAENAVRRRLAEEYGTLLGGCEVIIPTATPGMSHVYHQYVIRHSQREALRDYLRRQGIGTLVHYPVPVHLQPAYAGRIATGRGLPHTEAVAREIVSLPMYAELSLDQVRYVAEHIARFCSVC